MHGILGATHTRRNPRNCPAIRQTFARNENYAYPDTLGIFMRYWPAGALKTIARLQRGGGDVQLKRSLYKDPLGNFRVYGSTIIIQRPNEKTLDYLDDLERENKVAFVISMVDIACDFISDDEKTKEQKTQIIRDHVLLRHRRAGLMRQDEHTLGWNNQSDRGRQVGKNLVLYDDKPSKETGEVYCTHLELRLRKARLLRSNGIETIQDLRSIDPQKLFDRNVRLTAFNQEDKEAYINRAIRNSYKKNLYHPKDKRREAFAERYNAGLLKKLKHVAHKGLHAGQVIKGVLGPRNSRFNQSLNMDVLCIPRVLSIPTVSMRKSSSCVVSVDLFRVNDACLHMDIGRDTKTKIKNRKKLMSNRDESADRWYPTKIYKPKPRKEKPKPEPRPSSLFRRDEGEPQKTKQRWPTH